MTLRLPTIVGDPAQQEINDTIARAFPVSGPNLGPPARSVTELPKVELYAGKQVLYKAAAGVFWNLVYTAESAEYPWNCIGGPPLVNEVAANETTTSATFTNLATVGPSLTAPLKGEYDVDIGTYLLIVGGTTQGAMSYSVGGAAPLETDVIAIDNSTATYSAGSISRSKRKVLSVAETSLVAKYKAAGAGVNSAWVYRWMKLDPVRVG